MDEISQYNIARWKALAQADSLFTRPRLTMTVGEAQQRFDPEGRLGQIAGKDVLCLAAGGGVQSAAFALLGARVTVFDLSDAQLERDHDAAVHYGVEITTQQGDMRDLSALEANAFDIVYQPYAINFVPDAKQVFQQVARVSRPGGLYHLHAANPFVSGLTEAAWNGEGYVLNHPYVEGQKITYPDQVWVYDREQNATVPMPQEFRHTLSTLMNGLIENGFTVYHLSDQWHINPDREAEPGTWDHFVATVPPWLVFWSKMGKK